MSAETWIKFYPSDWLHGTSILTAEERGVYITLIMLMYDRGGALPLNEKLLARQCNMQARSFKTVLQSLLDQEKITLENGEIFNEKVAKLLQEFFSRKGKASNGGKAKAEKYSSKNNETTSANAQPEQTPSTPQAQPKQRSSSAKPETRSQKPENNLTPRTHNQQSAAQQPDAVPRLAEDRIRGGELEEALRQAAGWWHAEPGLAVTGPIEDLIEAGASLEKDVLPIVRARSADAGSRTSWNYFTGPIADALKARQKATQGAVGTPRAVSAPDHPLPPKVRVRAGSEAWEAWVKHYRAKGKIPPNPISLKDEHGHYLFDGWWFDSEWPPGHAQAA